jgi:hypothetical protein
LLVFNYGSNLSKEQFSRRCPTAKLVGIAKVKDHRLTFTGWSNGRAGSVATIKPAEGREAVGAVYELQSPEDVRTLDRAEGFPSVYDCEELEALVKIKGRYRKRKVWAYVKVDQDEGQPSSDYLKTVSQGYRDHGLPTKYLAVAITELPLVWNKPKTRPTPFARYAGPNGKQWSWESGWQKAKPAVRKAKGRRKQNNKKGKSKKRKQRKTASVMVMRCNGLNGGCPEDLTDPCTWCPKGKWHCAHCCPKVSSPSLFY